MLCDFCYSCHTEQNKKLSLYILVKKESYQSLICLFVSIPMLLFRTLAVLTKMSEGFADCQDFIQLKEQEFFSLKLKHALDLKVELIK